MVQFASAGGASPESGSAGENLQSVVGPHSMLPTVSARTVGWSYLLLPAVLTLIALAVTRWFWSEIGFPAYQRRTSVVEPGAHLWGLSEVAIRTSALPLGVILCPKYSILLLLESLLLAMVSAVLGNT